MRATKWIFFAFIGFVAVVIAGIAVSFAIAPPRDPHTLYTAFYSNIKSLDPAELNDTTGSKIAGQVYETLYAYKYNAEPYQLIPDLAAELPHVSDGGRVMTIRLRRGIRFYDPSKSLWPDGIGPEVTARDFLFSWKRIASFQLASPNYSAIFEGKIEGLDAWWDYTKSLRPGERVDWDREVTGFQAADDYTLRITLTEPYPQLRYNLAHLPTAVVSREAVEKFGDRFSKRPVGTGAYALHPDDYREDQRLVMHANPLYAARTAEVAAAHGLSVSGALPHIPRLQFDYFRETLPAWILFRQGLFDVNGIPKDAFRQAVSSGDLTPEMRARGVVLRKAPEPATYYYGFNMNDPVVGRNKPLRQAMSMAFDRETYIQTFLNGRGQAAIGVIPPGFPTYDPAKANRYTRFDLAAAREKVKQAEREHGGPIPPLTLLMGDTDTATRQEADFVVTQMQRIGLKLNVEYRTWARFQEMIDTRQAQIFGLGWVADYPDEQTFLQLFYGKNAGPNGVNPSAYDNPAFDALYTKASVMEPGPERDALYREMEQIVMEDCPWIITFYPVQFTLYYDWLSNFTEMDYGHGMRKFYVLDEAARQRRLAGR